MCFGTLMQTLQNSVTSCILNINWPKATCKYPLTICRPTETKVLSRAFKEELLGQLRADNPQIEIIEREERTKHPTLHAEYSKYLLSWYPSCFIPLLDTMNILQFRTLPEVGSTQIAMTCWNHVKLIKQGAHRICRKVLMSYKEYTSMKHLYKKHSNWCILWV